jgi:hypothetical protein
MIVLMIHVLFLGACRDRSVSKGGGEKKESVVGENGRKDNEKPENREFEPKITVLRPESAKLKPDFERTPQALVREFKQKGQATGEKYKGKILEMSGRVRSVWSGGIVITTDPSDPFEAGFICRVPAQHMGHIKILAVGQRLSVLGRNISEGAGNVDLELFSFTELEPTRLIVTSAEMVASEFEKDADAAIKKYTAAKEFVLSGRIGEFKQLGGLGSLSIVGTSTTKLVMLPTEPLSGKTEIEFRASLDRFDPNSHEIVLDWKYLIGSK